MASATTARHLEKADKLWHLQQTALVSGLSPHDLLVVARSCSDRVFEAEHIIFEESEAADQLYILCRGCVRLEVIGPGQQEKITSILRNADVFGVQFLNPQRLHRTRAVAHQESWILTLQRDRFLKLTEKLPSLLLNLIGILNRRLTEARQDIEALSCLSARQQVADTLLRLGQRHGRRLVTDRSRVKLKIPLSHKQLAKLTGGNRPHVSTIMSGFRKDGLLSYQGRRLLLDTQRLASVRRPAKE